MQNGGSRLTTYLLSIFLAETNLLCFRLHTWGRVGQSEMLVSQKCFIFQDFFSFVWSIVFVLTQNSRNLKKQMTTVFLNVFSLLKIILVIFYPDNQVTSTEKDRKQIFCQKKENSIDLGNLLLSVSHVYLVRLYPQQSYRKTVL